MAPPPPSQAGKFKPRKAVKKVPIATPGSAAAGGSSNNDQRGSSAPHGSPRGGGGRGRGRGDGAGGRGRGRGPQPQGQVFFTAGAAGGGGASGGSSSSPKNTLANKVKAARAANAAKANATANSAMQRATGAVQVKRENETQEEVVGTMEEGVGFTAQNSEAAQKIKAEAANRANGEFELEEDNNNAPPTRSTITSKKSIHGMETFQYDSDSSEEEAAASSRQKGSQRNNIVPPLCLPYPGSSASVGIGGSARPVFYPGEGYNLLPDKDNVPPTKYGHMTAPVTTVDPVGMSPFVDIGNTDSLRVEQDSWFLVQLPTRLPRVVQQSDDTNTGNVNNDNNSGPMDVSDAQQQQPVPTAATADVRTAPVQTTSFDNVLSSAKPGRIGRMLVYKSGKTVLVLEGKHIGDPPVSFECCCLYMDIVYSACYYGYCGHPQSASSYKSSAVPDWESMGYAGQDNCCMLH
jgi:hypothetical protein